MDVDESGNGRIDIHTGWLERIERKVDTIITKQSEVYRIIGQHEVKICAQEDDINSQGEDVQRIIKIVHRVGIGIIMIIIAAVVGVYVR